MALKTSIPSSRPTATAVELFEEITKHKPERSLTVALRKSGGRNNTAASPAATSAAVISAATASLISSALGRDEPATVLGIESRSKPLGHASPSVR